MVPLKTIGLMSGTSFDGVDAALTGAERELLRGALADAITLRDRTALTPGGW